MVISNYLLSPTFIIPTETPTWSVLTKFSANPRNCS